MDTENNPEILCLLEKRLVMVLRFEVKIDYE